MWSWYDSETFEHQQFLTASLFNAQILSMNHQTEDVGVDEPTEV